MFHVTLKRPNEQRQEQIEKRLNDSFSTVQNRNLDDPTLWAVGELSADEFSEVDTVSWIIRRKTS